MTTRRKTTRKAKSLAGGDLSASRVDGEINYLSPNDPPLLLRNQEQEIFAGLKLESLDWYAGELQIKGWTFGAAMPVLFAGHAALEAENCRFARKDVVDAYSLSRKTSPGFEINAKIQMDGNCRLQWSVIFDQQEKPSIFLFEINLGEKLATYQLKELAGAENETLIDKNRLAIVEGRVPVSSKKVLIVGSAPTIERHLKDIRNFSGDVWALNDAWFWLEANGIDVDCVFLTDTRALRKNTKKIENAKCDNIVVIDTVQIDSIRHIKKNVYILKSMGRDGFSCDYGEVYHGCSVFFAAAQTAVALKFTKITCCGVLLSPPGRYARIDGTNSMPEYVHVIQLRNASNMLRVLQRVDIKIDIFEIESNLNFL